MAMSPPPAQWVPSQQFQQHHAPPAVQQRDFSAEVQKQVAAVWATFDAARQLNGPMSDIAGFLAAVVGAVYHSIPRNAVLAQYAIKHSQALVKMTAAIGDARAMDNALMHIGWTSCLLVHTDLLYKFWQSHASSDLTEPLKRVLSSVAGAELGWTSPCSLAPFGDSEGLARYCASTKSTASAFSGLSADATAFVLKQSLDPSACGLVCAQDWVTWLQLYGPDVAGATEMCLKTHAVPGFLGHVADSTAAAIMRASAVGSYGIAPARGLRGSGGVCNVFILYKTVQGRTGTEVTRSLMENLGSQGFMLDSGPAKSLPAVVLGNPSSLKAPPQHTFALSPWFHGADISFEATNERLRHAAAGVFFVRLSGSQPRSLVLAYVEQHGNGQLQVQQSILQRTDDGHGFQLAQYVFTDAADLVVQNSGRLASFLPMCAEVATVSDTRSAAALRSEFMQHASTWWQAQSGAATPGSAAHWLPPSSSAPHAAAAGGGSVGGAAAAIRVPMHGPAPIMQPPKQTSGFGYGQPASIGSVESTGEGMSNFLPPLQGAQPLSGGGTVHPSTTSGIERVDPVPPVPHFFGPGEGVSPSAQGGHGTPPGTPLGPPAQNTSTVMTGSIYATIPSVDPNDSTFQQQQQQQPAQAHQQGHQQGWSSGANVGQLLQPAQAHQQGMASGLTPALGTPVPALLQPPTVPYDASVMSNSTLATLRGASTSSAPAAAAAGGVHFASSSGSGSGGGSEHSSFLVPPMRGLHQNTPGAGDASVAGGALPACVAMPQEGGCTDDPPLTPPATLRQVSRTAKQLYDEMEAETGEQMWNEPVPEYLLCPISLQLVRDPVTADDNQTYERSHIQKWLASQAPGQWTSPLTRQPLASNALRPNFFARSAVDQFLHRQAELQQKKGRTSPGDPPTATAAGAFGV